MIKGSSDNQSIIKRMNKDTTNIEEKLTGKPGAMTFSSLTLPAGSDWCSPGKGKYGREIVHQFFVTVRFDEEILRTKAVTFPDFTCISGGGVHDYRDVPEFRNTFQRLQALLPIHHGHVDVEKDVVRQGIL